MAAHETRDGVMFAYKTPAPACSPSSWPRFHHDLANSGYYDRDAIDPGALTNVKYAAGKLTFTAPGDDLMCGKVTRYEAVQANFPLNGSNFSQGNPTPTRITRAAKSPWWTRTATSRGSPGRHAFRPPETRRARSSPARRTSWRTRRSGRR